MHQLSTALRVNVEGQVQLSGDLHEAHDCAGTIARRAATDRFLGGVKVELEESLRYGLRERQPFGFPATYLFFDLAAFAWMPGEKHLSCGAKVTDEEDG